MNGLNRIFIMGFLGSNPQSYDSKTGKKYTALSIATSRQIGRDGDRREATDWHYVRVWGQQGETCMRFLTKGQGVMVEGYLTQYSQEKPEGKSERRTGVNALHVHFLPKSLKSEMTSAEGVNPAMSYAASNEENRAELS